MPDLNRRTIAALNTAVVENERDRIARDAMMDDLQTSLDTHDAGEHLRSLRVLGSAFQGIRMTFDLMRATRRGLAEHRGTDGACSAGTGKLPSQPARGRATIKDEQSPTGCRMRRTGASVDGSDRLPFVLPRIAGCVRRFRCCLGCGSPRPGCGRRSRSKRIRGDGALPCRRVHERCG